jgi:hypothetical protein
MPEISRFYGIVIYMFYNEHNPPHFHISYQDFKATMEIKTGELNGKLPIRATKMVREWVNLHRDELLENWRLMEQRHQLRKIEPLD